MKRFNSLLCAALLTLSISSATFASNIPIAKSANVSSSGLILGSLFDNVTGIILYLL